MENYNLPCTNKLIISKRTGHAPVNSFLENTYKMLEENQFPTIVSWDTAGASIIIKNIENFSNEVLPALFGHNKFPSFVRQLHMYNFRKIKSEEGECIYQNPLFQRDKCELLSKLNRKKVKSKKNELTKPAVHSEETKQSDSPQKRARIAENYDNEIRSLIAEAEKTREMTCILQKEFFAISEEYQRLLKEHDLMKEALNKLEHLTLLQNMSIIRLSIQIVKKSLYLELERRAFPSSNVATFAGTQTYAPPVWLNTNGINLTTATTSLPQAINHSFDQNNLIFNDEFANEQERFDNVPDLRD